MSAAVSDRQLLEAVLFAACGLAKSTGAHALACDNSILHDIFLDALVQNHQICRELRTQLSARGWRPQPPPDPKYLQSLRQKLRQP